MNFDLLKEPWIPVRARDGTVAEHGLRDVLCNAQEYLEVTDPMVTREYGVYRFLFAFLMDAYRPESEEDLRDLLADGRFSPQVLEEYIGRCRREGVSFDLFDGTRPFMQAGAAAVPGDEKSESSVAYLEPSFPHGNNAVHFDHTFEDEACLTPAEAMRSLCAVAPFTTQGGRGYYSSVNGTPPVFMIVRGADLLETLLFGMVPRENHEPYSDPPPLWRWQPSSGSEPPYPSLLFGLTYPSRYIRFLADPDGLVRKMQYRPGLSVANRDEHGNQIERARIFRDPYVAYQIVRERWEAVLPKTERELWLDFGTALDCGEDAPFVVRQCLGLTENSQVLLTAYSLSTKQASFEAAKRGEYLFGRELLKSTVRWSTLKACLDRVEKQADRLRKTISRLRKSLGEDTKKDLGYFSSAGAKAESAYYETCRNAFFGSLEQTLTVCPLEKTGEVQQQWSDMVLRAAEEQYDSLSARTQVSARALLACESCRKGLRVQNGTNGKGR